MKFKRIACVALGLGMLIACAACSEGGTKVEKPTEGENENTQNGTEGTQNGTENGTENGGTEAPVVTWDTQTEGAVLTRPLVDNASLKELLTDLNFSRGFKVSLFHSNSSNGQLAGTLNYGGEASEEGPVWQIAQWGCTHDMAEEGVYTRSGSVLSYDDGGKTVTFDVAKTGSITLSIKGSEEYTPDEDGNIRERTDSTENWPHLLIEQTIGHTISAEAEHLYMEIEYEITKCESLVDRELYPEDTSINAAQFQWFITLSDVDPESVSYKETMWFGFSMYDTRAKDDTPDGFSAYDGGKEDSTGLFIYMPSLKQVAQNAAATSSEVTVPTAVIGKSRTVKIDILPWIKTALKTARLSGALTGASVEKLRIGSTNIGWELPGNYDAEAVISYMNVYEVF